MASPFHYFRKHQKPLIAIAAVLCMIIFVFSDALVGIIRSAAGGSGGSSRSGKSTVATWDGGSLNERELAILRSRRFFLSEFLRRLQITGAQRVIADGGTPTKPTIPDFVLPENTTARAVDMSVVTSRVFADLAFRTGIRVSDQVINHYLREAGFHRVGGDEVVELLKSFRVADRQANANILFESLRDNLMAHTYQSGTAFASQTILPEQRWEDWSRVNERIALEVAMLPVGGMLAEVPEPKEEELLAFYQEGKGRVGGQLQNVMGAERTSPDAGFTQPRKVRLHYLLGDVFRWSEKLQKTVTDAEIEDYYQRNKRTQFVQTDTSTLDSTDLTEATDTPATTEGSRNEPVNSGNAQPDTDTSAEEPDKQGRAEEEAEASDTAVDKAPETPAAEAPSAKEGTSEEGSVEDEDAEEAAAKETPSDSTGESHKLAPFHLVAFQQAGDATEGEETLTDSTDSESAAEILSDAEDDSHEAAVVPPTSEAENQESAEPAKESDPVEGSATEPAEDGGAEKAEDEAKDEGDEEEQVQYLPLEEVREQIRRQLATDKAVKQLKTTVDRLFIQLRTVYNEEYGEKQAVAMARGSELPDPPQQLTSLGDLAKEHGLIYEETPLLSGLQLARESLVGKAMDARTGRASVTQRMLGEHALYDPLIAKDIDGNWYLVIKVEDVPQHIPQFDEIRSEVVKAWKIQKAFQVALEKAKTWAAEAKKSSDSFGEFFSDKQLADNSKVEVVTTDLFSWLTFGATPAEMQRGARLGDAPPLAGVGPEFMTGAFELKQDEVKVLQNYDHSQVYVAKIHQREMSKEQLRNLFLSESNSWFGARFSTMARLQRFQRMVFQQLTERVNLNFEEGWGQ